MAGDSMTASTRCQVAAAARRAMGVGYSLPGYLAVLRRARDTTKGYPSDLAAAFVEEVEPREDSDANDDGKPMTTLDAGDLFRTLVLDAGWSVAAASFVYSAAMGVVSGR